MEPTTELSVGTKIRTNGTLRTRIFLDCCLRRTQIELRKTNAVGEIKGIVAGRTCTYLVQHRDDLDWTAYDLAQKARENGYDL